MLLYQFLWCQSKWNFQYSIGRINAKHLKWVLEKTIPWVSSVFLWRVSLAKTSFIYSQFCLHLGWRSEINWIHVMRLVAQNFDSPIMIQTNDIGDPVGVYFGGIWFSSSSVIITYLNAEKTILGGESEIGPIECYKNACCTMLGWFSCIP